MRIALSIALATLPYTTIAQQPSDTEPGKPRFHITGCVKGSTLTETTLRLAEQSDKAPKRRWRLRGPKDLMNRLKKQSGKELEIIGTTTDPGADAMGRTRIGQSPVYVGPGPMGSSRDPLPDLPTLDVQSFELTGETCR